MDTETEPAGRYSTRSCRGHWHVTIGEDDIGDAWDTEAEAEAEAARLNQEVAEELASATEFCDVPVTECLDNFFEETREMLNEAKEMVKDAARKVDAELTHASDDAQRRPGETLDEYVSRQGQDFVKSTRRVVRWVLGTEGPTGAS